MSETLTYKTLRTANQAREHVRIITILLSYKVIKFFFKTFLKRKS